MLLINCAAMANLIHTCYRITDIDRSVAFYKALGFEEVGRIPIRDEAINVFMNLPGRRGHAAARADLQLRRRLVRRSARATATSRSPPTTSTRRSSGSPARGSSPRSRPTRVREGGSRLCFVRDPDGYRIELIEKPSAAETR